MEYTTNGEEWSPHSQRYKKTNQYINVFGEQLQHFINKYRTFFNGELCSELDTNSVFLAVSVFVVFALSGVSCLLLSYMLPRLGTPELVSINQNYTLMFDGNNVMYCYTNGISKVACYPKASTFLDNFALVKYGSSFYTTQIPSAELVVIGLFFVFVVAIIALVCVCLFNVCRSTISMITLNYDFEKFVVANLNKSPDKYDDIQKSDIKQVLEQLSDTKAQFYVMLVASIVLFGATLFFFNGFTDVSVCPCRINITDSYAVGDSIFSNRSPITYIRYFYEYSIRTFAQTKQVKKYYNINIDIGNSLKTHTNQCYCRDLAITSVSNPRINYPTLKLSLLTFLFVTFVIACIYLKNVLTYDKFIDKLQKWKTSYQTHLT